MTRSSWKKLAHPVGLTAFAAATLLSACSRDEDLSGPVVKPESKLQIALEVSRFDAAPGQRIAVAIAGMPKFGALGAIQGTLRFNPTMLRYVGQDADAQVASLVNAGAATRGTLAVVTVNLAAKPLARRTAVLTFEVLGGNYASSLGYELSAAANPRNDTQYERADFIGAVPAADLAPSDAAKMMTLQDWATAVMPEWVDGRNGKIFGVPGELQSGLLYGDTSLDGNINAFDVLFISQVAANLLEPIVGTASPDRDFVLAGNVAPANLPGIGEVGDAIPPGVSGSSSNIDTRSINVFDALDIANDVAAFLGGLPDPTPVVRSVIPGREASQFGRPTSTVSCPILASRTFFRDSVYVIPNGASATDVCNVGTNDGTGANTVLTVQAGTRIELGSTRTLVINRNAQIQAVGTLAEPITFTCSGVPTNGCWGGFYINGNASINNGTATSPAIAGRQTGGALEAIGEGNTGLYGGNSDTDNSGTLKFVIIEGAGTIFTGTAERNGLTLQAVGSGTSIDYVQSRLGRDDGIEWFGGTVDVKHAYVDESWDDSFDWVGGWRGRAQYLISRGCNTGCDNGIEADNFGIDGGNVDPEATPKSNPTIYNATLLGVNGTITATTGFHGMLLRQNTNATIRNVLVFGYKAGLDVDSTGQATAYTGLPVLGAICNQLNAGTLSVQFGYFGQNTADGDADAADPKGAGVAPYCNHSGSNLEATYLADAANNLFTGQGNASAHLVDPWSAVPDFRLLSGSSVATCGTPPSGGFFDTAATYCGGVPRQNTVAVNLPWYSGWTVPRN